MSSEISADKAMAIPPEIGIVLLWILRLLGISNNFNLLDNLIFKGVKITTKRKGIVMARGK